MLCMNGWLLPIMLLLLFAPLLELLTTLPTISCCRLLFTRIKG